MKAEAGRVGSRLGREHAGKLPKCTEVRGPVHSGRAGCLEIPGCQEPPRKC